MDLWPIKLQQMYNEENTVPSISGARKTGSYM